MPVGETPSRKSSRKHMVIVGPAASTATFHLALTSLTVACRRQPPPRCSFSETSLEALRKDQREFVTERGWGQFHTPRSLALAMVGEVGEVCELLQWRSDDDCQPGLPGWSAEEKVRLGEELADVLSYVMRLSDVAEIDLPAAFLDKMAKNRAKCPAEQVYGSAAKYTEYRQAARAAEAEPPARAAEAQPARPEAEAEGQPEPGEEQDPRRAGEREWGQPAWVSDAYARAAARFEQKTGAAAPGTSAAASEVAGPASVDDDRGEVEIDAATWASSVRARAKAKAEADMNS